MPDPLVVLTIIAFLTDGRAIPVNAPQPSVEVCEAVGYEIKDSILQEDPYAEVLVFCNEAVKSL